MLLEHYDYLIVGAGLYGLTCARLLTNKGFSCLVIDRRSHVGGTCYTRKFGGIDIHEYGPHIFHTSDEDVWEFVGKYSKFRQFELKVCATDGEKVYSLPFNMFTFSEINGQTDPSEVFDSLNIQEQEVKNLEEQAIRFVGRDVYEKLIKGYTEKQWGKACKDLPSSIIKRLPVRYSYDNNYFNDKYQGLPENGYTELANNIIRGKNSNGKFFEGPIEVILNTNFLDNKEEWLKKADNIIYCGSVDELLDYKLGKLSWRSLRWEHKTYTYNGHNGQGCPILNNTDSNTPYTRTIDHLYFDRDKVLTYCGETIQTNEYPDKWEEGKERFYPNGSESLYDEYVGLLKESYPSIQLGGRIGLYRYMDMDDTIKAAFEFCSDKRKYVFSNECFNGSFCKIWVIGTNDGDVDLGDTTHYSKFITKSSMARQNINPYNRFLSEFVAMWYVWKNNIYSQYVGFCHYKRRIEIQDILFNNLNGKIQYFYKHIINPEYIRDHFSEDSEYPFIIRKNNDTYPDIISKDMAKYLNIQEIIPTDKIKDYCTVKDRESFILYNREIYVCEWETFCELMNFVGGFIEYIADKYNLSSYNDWAKHISKNIIALFKKRGRDYASKHNDYSNNLIFQKREDWLKIFDEDEGLNSFCNCWRVYSYSIEELISIFIGTHDRICGKLYHNT